MGFVRSMAALGVIAALLAGCGASAAPSPGSAAASPASAAAASPASAAATTMSVAVASAAAATGGGNGAFSLKLPPGRNGQFKVGIAARELVNDSDRLCAQYATAAIEAAGGTVVVTDAGTDNVKQNQNVESLINSGIDGLIIELGQPDQLAPMVAEANAKKIPVVTIMVGYVAGAVTDVGLDNALGSELQTRALLMAMHNKGDLYAFNVPGAPVLDTRKRVFDAMLQDYPLVTVHEVSVTHGDAEALADMQDILTAHPQKGSITAVWCAYDELCTGVVQAIIHAGRGGDIVVTGHDGDKVGFQMLYEPGSPFVATVAVDFASDGTLAGQAIVTAADGQAAQLPLETFARMWQVTRNNGLAAGELKWGSSLWSSLKMDPSAIAAQYPQNQPVTVFQPEIP